MEHVAEEDAFLHGSKIYVAVVTDCTALKVKIGGLLIIANLWYERAPDEEEVLKRSFMLFVLVHVTYNIHLLFTSGTASSPWTHHFLIVWVFYWKFIYFTVKRHVSTKYTESLTQNIKKINPFFEILFSDYNDYLNLYSKFTEIENPSVR